MYLAAAGSARSALSIDERRFASQSAAPIIHTTPDIGRRKVDSAAEQIHAPNPMSGLRRMRPGSMRAMRWR